MQLDDLRQRYILDVSSVVAGANQVAVATGKVTQQQQKMNALNRELYGSFRLAIRRAGAAAFAVLLGSIYKAIQGFTRFQKEIAEVETLINANTAAIGHFSAEVRRLARVTPLALSDLTKGLYQTISAAVPAEEAIRFLGVAARAAVGGVTEVAVAVDGMTSVLNAFALEARDAEDIADTFFVSIRDGKTTFAELSKNIGTVAPSAAALGLSFQELISLMTAMTLQGLSTDKAAVALRGLFTALEDPAQEAIEMAKELNIEWSAQALLAKGVIPFLAELKEKTDAYSGAVTVLVGNSRAANGLNALLGNGLGALGRTMSNQTDRAGQAAEAYRKLNIVGETTWEVFKNRVQDTFQQLGKSTFPLVADAIRGISSALDALRDPSERIKDVFASLGLEIEGMSDEFDRLLIAETKARFAGKRFSVGSQLLETKHVGTQTDPITGDTVTVDWGTFRTNVVSKQIAEDFWKGLTDEQRLDKVRAFISEIIDLFTQIKEEEIKVKTLFAEGKIGAGEKDAILLVLAERSDELKSQVTELNEYRDALEKSIGATKRLADNGVSTVTGRPIERPKIPQRTPDTEGITAALRETESFREKMILASAATEELRDALQSLFDLQKDEGDLTKGGVALMEELIALKAEEKIFQDRLNIALANKNVFSERDIAISEAELAVKQEQVKAVEAQVAAITRATNAAHTQIAVVEEGIKKWILSAQQLRDMGFDDALVDALTGDKGFIEFKGISEATAAAFKEIEASLSEIDKQRFEKALKDAEEFRDAMQDAAEAMSAVARVMRDLGVPDLAGIADSIGGLLSVLPSLRAAGGIGFGNLAQTAASLSTVASIASLGVSIGSAIASALGGNDPSSSGKLWDQRRERDQIIKDAADTFKRAADTIAKSATAFSGVTPDVFATALGVAQRAQRSGLRPTRFPTTPLTEEQMRRLAEAPTREEFFEALAAIPGFEDLEQHFQDLVNTGMSQENALQAILDQTIPLLESIALGVSGANLAGLEREIQIGRDFLGDTPQQSFDRMIDFLGGLENLPEHIRNVLLARGGLDVTTPEGQAALAQLIEGIAQNLLLGNTFGLSAEEIENILLPLLDSFRTDLGDIDSDISRSVQIARTITEIQANELLAIQESALLTLERILERMPGSASEGNTYNISIDIPPDTTNFGRRILEEIEQEIRLKEAS